MQSNPEHPEQQQEQAPMTETEIKESKKKFNKKFELPANSGYKRQKVDNGQAVVKATEKGFTGPADSWFNGKPIKHTKPAFR